MAYNTELSSFRDVAEKHKVIFLDSFGVIKNYRGLIPGVLESINEMRQDGKRILVLTNDSSKSPELLAHNFRKLGLAEMEEKDIITSGMMAQEFVKNKVKNGTVAYVGTKQSEYYVRRKGITAVSVSELDMNDIDDVSCLVFLDDEGFEWQFSLNKAINLLKKKSIPVVVANSDNTYPVSKTEVNIATGALARMMEYVSKKRFVYFGKPDSQMYMKAYEIVSEESPLHRNEILMVGDTLSTDILGGNKFGLSTALVLSGNTSEAEMRTYMKSTGINPDYICPSIAFD